MTEWWNRYGDAPTLDEIVRLARELEAAAPPSPSRVMASHAVPYGRCYRQWMTNGELWLWANRGELADLPRIERHGVTFGIPVVNA